jgi:hypothetical protein
MNEQEKDNLENFFKDRAQRHNLEFNESDWLMLEKQLDKEMPVVNPFWTWLRKYWAIPLLLILLPVGWYSYSFIYSSTEVLEANSNQEQILSSGESELSVKEGPSEAEINSKINEEDFTEQLSKNQDDIQTQGSNTIQNQLLVEAVSDKKDIENEKLGYVDFENGTKVDDVIHDNRFHFLSPIAPEDDLYQARFPDFMDKVSIMEIDSKKQFKPYLSIGLGYSPDFSTVGIGNFISPGARWKFLVEYAISRRFSINTGAVWVNNKYEAYGEDYHAPSRYWQKGVEATETYGECTMIDIPLNVRYNFLLKGNHSLFISGGASTYFLLKEDYYFSYYQEDPELPKHWGTDETSIYPFGIINLSMGYQLQLGRKSSVQIEPFIKIPTKGIGWGEVDLHTMGVYFMYTYKLGK